MIAFIVRRILIAFSTVMVLSVLIFFIIQVPAGDYLDAYLAFTEEAGTLAINSREEVEKMRDLWGLDKPLYLQYLKWIKNVAVFDLGISLSSTTPVAQLIGERIVLTVGLALSTVLFTWTLAIPIGIYSAVRQHSVGDYTFTFIGFIGLAVPDFLLALVIMYFAFQYFGSNIGGLFSFEYIEAPWSVGRLVDMLTHMWQPALVLGTSGTATLIRIMRANLLDELHRPYVVTARAKGMSEIRLILKYPVRVALNPFFSTIGYVLPYLISGSIIVSVVLSLPTVGPILLRSLLQQDMYLAGTIILLLGALTVLGTLISDILLMIFDPRIRLEDS